jgi:hypothetical protein
LRVDARDTAPRPGDTVRLSVEREQLHWFDPATQARLPVN